MKLKTYVLMFFLMISLAEATRIYPTTLIMNGNINGSINITYNYFNLTYLFNITNYYNYTINITTNITYNITNYYNETTNITNYFNYSEFLNYTYNITYNITNYYNETTNITNNITYNITYAYAMNNETIMMLNTSTWNRTGNFTVLANINDKVGIGTSEPNVILDIASSPLRLRASYDQPTDNIIGLSVGYTSNGYGYVTSRNYGASTSYPLYFEGSNFAWNQNAVTKMTLDANGILNATSIWINSTPVCTPKNGLCNSTNSGMNNATILNAVFSNITTIVKATNLSIMNNQTIYNMINDVSDNDTKGNSNATLWGMFANISDTTFTNNSRYIITKPNYPRDINLSNNIFIEATTPKIVIGHNYSNYTSGNSRQYSLSITTYEPSILLYQNGSTVSTINRANLITMANRFTDSAYNFTNTSGDNQYFQISQTASGTSYDMNIMRGNSSMIYTTLPLKIMTNYYYITYYNATGEVINQSFDVPLIFGTNTTATTGERMRITTAGLIGIGTTTPTTALEVNGGVKAINFTGNGYNLTQLDYKKFQRYNNSRNETTVYLDGVNFSGMTSHYNFNERTGNYANDNVSTNTVTFNSGSWETGKINNSITCTGANYGTSASAFTFTDYTLTYWFKTTSVLASRSMFSFPVALKVQDESGYFRVCTQSSCGQSGYINDGVWHFVSLNYNSSANTIYWYMDGSSTPASSVGGGVITNRKFYPCYDVNYGSYYFVGSLDSFRLYPKYLNITEMRGIYNQSYGTEINAINVSTVSTTINYNATLNFEDAVLYAKDYRVNSVIYSGKALELISSLKTKESKQGTEEKNFKTIDYEQTPEAKGIVGLGLILQAIKEINDELNHQRDTLFIILDKTKEQEAENQQLKLQVELMEKELCLKDKSYKFCD